MFDRLNEFFEAYGSWFIWGSVAILLGIIVLVLCLPKKDYTTKDIAFASTAVAMSFALSYVKVSFVSSGGSITLASIVPLAVYCYYAKTWKGVLGALAYSVLQLFQSFNVISVPQLLFDYIFPFTIFGGISVIKLLSKNNSTQNPTIIQKYGIVISVACAFVFRFVCHFITGAMPDPTGWGAGVGGSLVYQLTYVPADMIIACAVLFALVHSGALKRIEPFMGIENPQLTSQPNN